MDSCIRTQGQWNGQQIIAKNWVKKTLSPLVPNGQTDSDGYGYFFWHKTYEVDGKIYPCAYASGNGGNKLIIFENLPIVIVITATAYGNLMGIFKLIKSFKIICYLRSCSNNYLKEVFEC